MSQFGVLVNDRKNAKPAPIRQRVRHEIKRPTLVWIIRQHHRLSGSQSTLSAASAAHLKLLFAIDAPHLLVVHLKTFPGDHHVDTPITKPSPLPRNSLDGISQVSIIASSRLISHRCSINLQNITRPPLAHAVHLAQMN
jgi:hypothetical protein